ncbi:MAG: anaerobic glycerol-3-phosphate dehydrogenase subunit A [Bacteroidales bacterium]|nr:anaerobic glycerol-3-phosphate dehydrogenase subunit A [Bacteroidales bacterium]
MGQTNKGNEFDVIIVGGGITGAGTARDCALRGLNVLLIERHDIATGATGRNHGLLHSGARYAVKDSESAEECIKENTILRKIASNCVEDTQGLFITLPEDADSGYGLDYQKTFIEACIKAGINAEAIDPKDAIRMEPSVNPRLIGAVKVPDGSVDPFRLCAANITDAKLHGAKVLVYTEVTEFIKENDTILGVKVRDSKTGETAEYRAPVTVNAAGIWGHNIAEMAGVHVGMYPAKGALLVFGHRVNNVVINRCRKSADGDILVPGDTVCVIGTTSTKVPFEECDNMYVTRDEVELLLREGCALAPSLATTRILRAYAGVRPLVASDDDPTGRSISRGIVCLDHETRDGLKGFITITGGKLMTYRLMSEIATDAVCKKLNIAKKCQTATTPIIGSETGEARKDTLEKTIKKIWSLPTIGQKAAAGRFGTRAADIPYESEEDRRVICECEQVTLGEIKYAVKTNAITSLEDLRRRTRIGMGTCQGTFCIYKAAAALAEALGTPEKADIIAKDYLNERWKGMTSVGWGDTLREMEFMQRVYKRGIPDSYKNIPDPTKK